MTEPAARGKVMGIGLDGLALHVLLPCIEQGGLSTLSRLFHGGTHGVPRSVTDMTTGPTWVSIATGCSPARPGILHDFHHDRGRYRVGPTSGRDGRVPAIWQVALALGRPALVLNVPYTSPVQPWRAIQLAGIDAPGENAPGFDRAPGELSPHAPHGWGLRHRLMLFLTVRAFTDLPLRRLAAIETAWIASRSPTSAVTVLPLGPGIAEARMAVLLLALVPALLASASAIPVRMETTPGRVLVAGLRAAPAAIGPGTGDSRGGLGDGADLAPGGRHD